MQLQKDEAERLAALANYGIVDTGFEEAYDSITCLVAKIFNAPISLVSIIDRHRQWSKSAYGVPRGEAPRELAFCSHAIQQSNVFIVPNAKESEIFRNNPMVTGEPHVAFYAGAPLINPDGYALGSLCVVDNQPRNDFSSEDERILQDFAKLVVTLLEQRKELRLLKRGLQVCKAENTQKHSLLAH